MRTRKKSHNTYVEAVAKYNLINTCSLNLMTGVISFAFDRCGCIVFI